MDVRYVAVLVILLSRIQARSANTCQDLERDVESRDFEIERLKSELEEYKLGDRNNAQNVPDECNVFTTCTRCLHEDNTKCGWCFLLNKCSLKEHCFGSELNSTFWLPYGGKICPKINNINPHSTALVQTKEVEINIPPLPPYDGVFVCSFEAIGKTIIRKASRTDNGVVCFSPTTDDLPRILHDSKSMQMNISVRTANGPNFAKTTNFSIYDCRLYDSCTTCVSSPYPCFWSTMGHRCTHDVSENGRNENFIDSLASGHPSTRSGPGFCPRVSPTLGISSEIIVPAGKKRLSIKVDNIMPFIALSKFHCKVQGHEQVVGQLLMDTIYCDIIDFRTIHQEPVSNLSFNVFWDGGSKRLDNPQAVHVVVYDCSLMASSCGMCLEIPEKYQCGWCEDRNSCMLQANCGQSVELNKRQRCTKSDILSFHPVSGLITQETNITLTGTNFGRKFKDIDGGVSLITVGGELISECKPYEELYVATSKIVCQLAIPKISERSNGTLRGYFRVKVFDEFVATSTEDFLFVDPIITGLSPVKGIKSGGTYLEIQGTHLDAGDEVEISIAGHLCDIVSRNELSIHCITSASKRTLSSTVIVTFDGGQRFSPSYFFYVEDPWIRSVKTEFHSDGPRGTPSGGNLILVGGLHFDNVLNPPYMYVIVEDEEYIGACNIESSESMKCLSPKVPAEKLNFCGHESFLTFDYGFKMDAAVDDVQNISSTGSFQKFKMYADPFIHPFSGEGRIKIHRSDWLVIDGRHLDRVFSENDVVVEIGSEKCPLTVLSYHMLSCKPPAAQPPAMDGDPKKLPEVVVKIAERMEFFVGYLRYSS